MALYENVFIARQDVPATQVEALTTPVRRAGHRPRRHGRQERVLGSSHPHLPHQEEPQGALLPAQHRRARGGGEGDGAPDVDQRRHPALPDRARRRARGRPLGDLQRGATTTSDRPGGDRGDRWGDRPPRPRASARSAMKVQPDAGVRSRSMSRARRPFFRRRKVCPFSGAERAEDRLQGRAAAAALRLRARQDRADRASPRCRPRSSANSPRRSSAPASWRSSPTS